MRKALRPYLTAGVAVVGAGALAIAPVIATPPDVRIVNPAVQESGGPLDSYVETVREALANLEALLGSALALPAPTGWTLELALDNLFNDPTGNVALFVDELEARGPLAGASVPALLQNAADSISSTVEQVAAGNVDLAIVGLIKTYVILAPAVTAIVAAPLTLLGPEPVGTASAVLARFLDAAVGPALGGVGATGVAIQHVVDALDDAKPGSGAVFSALIAAPGTVLDGVFNGFTDEPDQITLPGLLTPGDPFDPTKPNPVAPATGVARGFGDAFTPHSVGIVAAPTGAESVTLAIDETQDETRRPDPDDATNQTVVADRGGPEPSVTRDEAGQLFGAGGAVRSVGGAGPSDLRQGVRDGVRQIRDGVRDVVRTVTAGKSGGEDAAEAGPVGP